MQLRRKGNAAAALVRIGPIAFAFAVACHAGRPVEAVRSGCAEGLVVIDGACVGLRDARAYCGATAKWDGARCTARACPEGEAIDTTSGACIVSRALREIAERDRLAVASDETVGCHLGYVLAIASGHAACLPAEALCARGTHWMPPAQPEEAGADAQGGCIPDPACTAGAIAVGSKCVSLVVPGAREDGTTIDASLWARAVLGPDGGAGTSRICGALAQNPRSFGAAAAAGARITLMIELVFPNNDITQASVHVDARPPLPQDAAALASRTVESLLTPLRALGGTASVASLRAAIACTVAGGPAPMAVPKPVAP